MNDLVSFNDFQESEAARYLFLKFDNHKYFSGTTDTEKLESTKYKIATWLTYYACDTGMSVDDTYKLFKSNHLNALLKRRAVELDLDEAAKINRKIKQVVKIRREREEKERRRKEEERLKVEKRRVSINKKAKECLIEEMRGNPSNMRGVVWGYCIEKATSEYDNGWFNW